MLFQLETLQKSKEEAHITADAFRIAFEQQLTRKNDQALRLARGDMCGRAAMWLNRQHRAEDGTWGARGKNGGFQLLWDIIKFSGAQEREMIEIFHVVVIHFKFTKCWGLSR